MFALDTNTISYYFRGDPQVVPRIHALPPARVGVPSVVVYELRYGLMRLAPAAAQSRLEAAGQPIGPHDLFIAATALRNGAALVTRNVAEFSRVPGLEVVNWHDGSVP